MAARKAVGQNLTRIDSLAKVTGQARFMSDQFVSDPELLHAKILWSAYPHARLVRVDPSEAERLPGVEFIITGNHAPEHRYGLKIYDRHVIAKDYVRSLDDPVAAVAATSAEIAEEALKLIIVEYEELPAIFDPEEAFGTDPPVVVHPELESYQKTEDITKDLSDVADMPNLCGHFKIRQGDVDTAFREADLIVENRYTSARVAHCQMENDCCTVQMDADGMLTVWTSQRVIYRIRRLLAQALGLDPSKIRVITSYIGGSFGRFPCAEYVAALMAMHTSRRVNIALTREECFKYTPASVPEVVYVKDGVLNDGTIIARQVRIMLNAGSYSHMAPRLTRTASYGSSGDTYNTPNFKLDAYAVYTNELLNCMHRGVCVPQTQWAIENNMNEIAYRLKMDPAEFRKKNIHREGSRNVYGEVVARLGVVECLDKVTGFIKLDPKHWESGHGPWRNGRGLAVGSKFVTGGEATVNIKLHQDGSFELRHGSDEVGQGSDTVLAQMVAEEFGVDLDHIIVVRSDSAAVPYADGASGSRTTFMVGNAIKIACADLKRQVFDFAAPTLGVPPPDLDTVAGRIFPKSKGPQADSIDLREIFSLGLLNAGQELWGTGTYELKSTPLDYDTGQSDRLNACYTHQAHAAEVMVNVETGEVKVPRFASAYNVGRAINPKLCEAQIEGGLAMAIGMAFWEEVVMRRGTVLNPNFTDYRLPTAAMMPTNDNVRSFIIELPSTEGPYGAKGLGEGVVCGHASALRAAIHDATGIWLYDMPMTAERVLEAFKDHGIQ